MWKLQIFVIFGRTGTLNATVQFGPRSSVDESRRDAFLAGPKVGASHLGHWNQR
jgi:hypothetical protein